MGIKTQDDAPRSNYSLTTFRMSNGCVGYYEVGWGPSLRSCNVKEFIGSEGRITLELKDQRIGDAEEGDRITVYNSKTGDYKIINTPAKYKDMYAQLETLINMIETDAPANPDIDDVFRSFLVSLAAEKAISTGTTVSLSDYESGTKD